jgi:hypothetical protein
MIRHVRLEVARCHEFPEGSREHGYELALPLTADGRLDRESWLTHRDSVGFRRFWDDEEERGVLKHARRGWTLSFAPGSFAPGSFAPGTDDDEVIFKGDEHRFAEGEYVSIKERDGITRTFRVASVK